jgi:hypothetical protein
MALMNFHVRVMTHAIPDSIGVAIPAMEVFAVKQPVLVADGFLQAHPGFTVGTDYISNTLVFHELVPYQLMLRLNADT